MSREMLIALAIGYVLGSIPFGLILTKLAGKGDVRDAGSGNIGATNVVRVGGKKLGALTLLLDALKGAAAVWLVRTIMPGEYGAGTVAAAGAMIGHLYPVWLKFRGGKGVATLFGVLVALIPAGAVIYAGIWIALLLFLRISSVAGIAAAASAPLSALLFSDGSMVALFAAFALVVIWKHRANIARLRAGTEPRIGRPRDGKA